MPGLEWLRQLAGRMQGYPLWQIAVELLVIGVIVYLTWKFVRGTRAAGALRALIILLVIGTVLVRLASRWDMFPRLSELYGRFLSFAAIGLVVIFQPELRRALIRIGELPAVRPLFRAGSAHPEPTPMIDAIVNAVTFLSKNKFGAIIAIERETGLREVVEGAKPVNADVSAELLESIFWPNNPLHDLGVVIKEGRILAAGVQFPMAEPQEMSDPRLGARHRAAVGLTKGADAVVVVVSEESGAISLAERGRLHRWLTPESLREELLRRLRAELIAQSDGYDSAGNIAGGFAGGDDEPVAESDQERRRA